MTPREFIDTIGPAARACHAKTGIPASFTVAQAALESGWGESELTKQAKNLFGIKADGSWGGDVVLMDTAEYVSGQRVMQQARFRAYQDWQGSIDDHAKFLQDNRRYRNAFGLSTGEEWAQAVGDAGYATDPQYAQKIINLMRSYRLDELDVQATETPTAREGNVMPAPILASIAASVVPALLEVLPFYARSERAKTNVAAAQQIAPVIIEAAKQASGQSGVAEAAQAVIDQPAAREKFQQAMALKWADLAPLLEFNAKERKEAREFGERMTGSGPLARQIGFALLIAALSLTVVLGGGWMFWHFILSEGITAEQKGMILGALIAAFTQVLQYFFGSSVGSRQKDQTIDRAMR